MNEESSPKIFLQRASRREVLRESWSTLESSGSSMPKRFRRPPPEVHTWTSSLSETNPATAVGTCVHARHILGSGKNSANVGLWPWKVEKGKGRKGAGCGGEGLGPVLEKSCFWEKKSSRDGGWVTKTVIWTEDLQTEIGWFYGFETTPLIRFTN